MIIAIVLIMLVLVVISFIGGYYTHKAKLCGLMAIMFKELEKKKVNEEFMRGVMFVNELLKELIRE